MNNTKGLTEKSIQDYINGRIALLNEKQKKEDWISPEVNKKLLALWSMFTDALPLHIKEIQFTEVEFVKVMTLLEGYWLFNNSWADTESILIALESDHVMTTATYLMQLCLIKNLKATV